MPGPVPVEIKLHQASKILELSFDDGARFELPCEFLRVYSPSAEVRGHGPGQEVLQLNKQDVNIETIEAMGMYAIKIRFSDGHDTGIYSYELLYNYGKNKDQLWQEYLEQLRAAGHTRKN